MIHEEANQVRAKRLKEIMIREQLNQGEFAKRVGYTQQYISQIQKGKKQLSEAIARTVVRAFPDYRLEWLLGYDDKAYTVNEDELLPCPFCGGKARFWQWNGGARVDCSRWYGTDGNEHYVGVGGKTAQEAIANWNRRTNVHESTMQGMSKKRVRGISR